MKLRISFAAFCLALSAMPSAALACRVRPPPLIPIDLARTPYEAVALAEVVSHDQGGAQIRFITLFDGGVDQATLRIGSDGPQAEVVVSSCGPPGPAVVTGDRIVVLLGRNAGRQHAIGWMMLADAERNDEFFPRFLAERRPMARRRLAARWREVNRNNGPVPTTDPARWMAPYAGSLELRGWEGTTRAEFEVAGDGRVVGCQTYQPGPTVARDAILCRRLGRQRFQPPIFARERRGHYEVRWNEQVGTRR
ncbi:MAG TPA: hypothetical protein VEX35_10150 [Allosphingosinicella sp.]|nr:hypothetical protein [Allosphingosinicella sp.]